LPPQWRDPRISPLPLQLSVLAAGVKPETSPPAMCEKNYFFTVTFAVAAIFIASPVSGVTTTSSIATVA
jgi:hypothetical protein